MSKAVNSKWKKTFPDTIGTQNRPATGVDDTQPFETGGFPQYIANDPVRYDLQNAAMSQSMSNDARLKEMVDARGKELDDHKVDPGAHKTGIAGNAATATKVVTTAAAGTSANIAEATMASSDSARIRVSGAENAGELALETADDGNEAIVARQYTGTYTTPVRTAKILDESGNTSFPGTVVAPKFTGSLNGNAATATKLQTPRTLSLTGKASGSATFDGSANAAINVTSVSADTASKLSTARKINITGNASGAATFDGSSDVSINVNVSQAAHADKATADANGNNIADTYVRHYQNIGEKDLNDLKLGGLYANPGNVNATAARHYPEVDHAGSIFVINNGVNGVDGCTQVYTTFDTHNSYKREYDAASKKWSAWRRYAFEDSTVANAQKLATARTISLTGNASGSANFDGSGNVSISTTVSMAAVANSATKLANNGNRNNLANGTRAMSGLSVYQCYLNTGYPQQYGNVISIGGTGDNELFLGWADDSRLLYRAKRDNESNWKSWRAIAFTDEINNYAPTKTGGGASGTWGINISGNAASATNADTVDGYHASDLLGKIYPVGSIYMSMSATNPHDLFGVGTWKRISQGRMLLGADDSTYKAGATGGEATHTLSVNEIPAHSHGISTSGDHSHYFYGSDDNNGPVIEGDGLDTEGNSHLTRNVRFITSSAGAHTHTISNSGGGAAHNNMPPYLVCYIWQRTA